MKARRVFRLVGRPEHKPLVEELLRAQGCIFSPLPFYSGARLLEYAPVPLGSSLAARFGYIYIQDASSMLPALSLAWALKAPAAYAGAAGIGNEEGRLVLDLCASPGGKSSLLAELLGPEALVLANEPAPKRLSALRHNLETLNILNSAALSFPGECPPLALGPSFAGFDAILLDPPCSGWGTAEKHPRVLSLWQGEKLRPLINLQRLLLREALRLLRPGGLLCYSTCTLNPGENEEQLRWGLQELRAEMGGGDALELLPLEPFPGFRFDPPAPGFPECAGSLRVSPDSELGQGFFIALLRKGLRAGPPAPGPRDLRAASGPRNARASKLTGRSEKGGPPFIPVAELNSPLLDAGLLPPGEPALLPSGLYFRHRSGLERLPASFPWQGFPLGKGREARPRPNLRALMPPPAQASAAPLLLAQDTAPIAALLSGQSLPLAGAGREAGLYYHDLPLCRLKLNRGRAFI